MKPALSTGAAEGGGGADVCLALAELQQEECLANPMQFFVEFVEGDWNMLLIDDTSINVSVGGGWLVEVSSSADYVGVYQYDGGSCFVGCGWWQPVQSLCYGDVDAEGTPNCVLCIEPGAGPVDQCAAFSNACLGGDEGPAPDTSGGDPDTSGGGVVEYDCSDYNPSQAVFIDASGVIHIDREIVDEIVDHFGEPLASCDGTRFARASTGYFALSQGASTGLLVQMGLRPGDVIVNANGVELNTLDAVGDVTADLFYDTRPSNRFT